MAAKPKNLDKSTDYELVYQLAKQPISNRDIAAILGISASTFDRKMGFKDIETMGLVDPKFQAAFYKGRSEWNISEDQQQDLIKRKQLELATNGNCTMLIFLGKAILKQRETGSIELSDDNVKLITESLDRAYKANKKAKKSDAAGVDVE